MKCNEIYIMNCIGDYKKYLIDPNTQLSLIQQYKETQDVNIRDKIILANIGLIGIAVNKFKKRDYGDKLSIDDMFDDGLIGLIKAIDVFDPHHGAMFSTYAGVCINNAIRIHIKASNRSITPSMHLEDTVVVSNNNSTEIKLEDQIQDDFDFIEHIEKECDIKAVLESLQVLNEKELKLINLRYLNGSEVTSQRTVAKELNTSQSHVCRIEKRAFCKMKEYLTERGII